MFRRIQLPVSVTGTRIARSAAVPPASRPAGRSSSTGRELPLVLSRGKNFIPSERLDGNGISAPKVSLSRRVASRRLESGRRSTFLADDREDTSEDSAWREESFSSSERASKRRFALATNTRLQLLASRIYLGEIPPQPSRNHSRLVMMSKFRRLAWKSVSTKWRPGLRKGDGHS